MGPFARTLNLPASYSLPRSREWGLIKTTVWNTQKSPWKDPLPFQMALRYVQSSAFQENTPGNAPVGYAQYAPTIRLDYQQLAENKAYSKFVAGLGDQSLWAVNLHERKQAVAMIVKRATQFRKVMKALNRFDFPAAWRLLGLGEPKTGVIRRSSKRAANALLELRFGWIPLVQDIEAAFKTIFNDPPFKRVVGRGSFTGSFVWDSGHRSDVYQCGCRLQADVRVSHPDLFLASQLGLLNPLGFAWEVVHLSFLVDWLTNVGQCLNSYTDFVGLEMTRSFVTHYTKATEVYSNSAYDYPPTHPSWFNTTFTCVGVYVERRVGAIPPPKLQTPPFRGLSVVRGATAIALLVQQFQSGPKGRRFAALRSSYTD